MSLPPTFGVENLVNIISNMLKKRKMMEAPLLDSRRGIIEDFRIPTNLRIGDLYEVSAVYKGSVKSGYFSLMIQDVDGVKQWFPDKNSIDQKLSNFGKTVQTGRLNFSGGTYEGKWKFRPERPLYAGHAKAIIHVFEDTDVYPLVFQEKDVHLI